MRTEEWRPIAAAHGYEVSSQGRVRSFKLGPTPQLLAVACRPRDGYMALILRVAPGVRKTFTVHALVAAAFIGQRPDGDVVVRHLDGNPANNIPSNLAYGTRGENILDTVRHGRHHMAKRTHCNHGHEFTPDNTYLHATASGRTRRRCKTCVQAKYRASVAA